jgi:hypothetical protein
MESTPGSSTAFTFRGVMSWLALRSTGPCPLSSLGRVDSERTVPRATTSGPILERGLRQERRGSRPVRDENLGEADNTSDGGRRFREASSFPDGEARRLLGVSPLPVQNEIATRGVRALVRSGIRSDGERSLADAPVQRGAKAPCTEALSLRGAAGWYLPAARFKGSM